MRRLLVLTLAGASIAHASAGPADRSAPVPTALDREPCVRIGFAGAPQSDATGHRQRVLAIALYRDGRQKSELFPYDWTYANPVRDNPFFRANAFRNDRRVRVQRPPQPLDPRTVSPIVAYVLEHVDARGHVHDRPCWPLPATADVTFPERYDVMPRRVAHAAADDLIVQMALAYSATGPTTICALALNVGTKPVSRVRLRWDFALRSGTVTTLRDWSVALAPTTVPPERWVETLGTMPRSTWNCAPISEDPRLKDRLTDIERISLTVLGAR